jgi:hypothetical protein
MIGEYNNKGTRGRIKSQEPDNNYLPGRLDHGAVCSRVALKIFVVIQTTKILQMVFLR